MKSKSLPKRIAIIEFDSSHDECLLTQINALKKRGCWVLLVTNDIVKSRNMHLSDLVDEWSIISDHGGNLKGAAIADALIIRRVMRFLKRRKVDKAIFNTAQGGHVRNACLFSLFRSIEFIGIVHTIRKFQGSFTQRIINWKIKKYFVLAHFLKNEVIHQHRKHRHQIEFFYPIDFPNGTNYSIKTDTIHISIIGSVESRRKDLNGFVSLIQQCDSTVRFSFLGKADPTHSEVINLKQQLQKFGCLDRVEFFENRVEFSKIDQILRKTNAILSLVHPNTPSAVEYFRHQIPGGMNLALAYQTPLLMHENYREIAELKESALYYDLERFSETVETLILEENTIRQRIENRTNYSLPHHQKVYLDFLFN